MDANKLKWYHGSLVWGEKAKYNMEDKLLLLQFQDKMIC